MNQIDMIGILFTGFPMKQAEMQIEAPPENPCQPVAEETDFSRDTQAWD